MAAYIPHITAVAAGCTKVNEIADKTKLDSSICVKHFKNLIELGIVKREIPIFDNLNSKKSIYKINDGMFRFWYKYVYENISHIYLGHGTQVYQEIKDQIPGFMGDVFESICEEYLWKAELPFNISQIGRLWGNNPIKKAEREIDLIAVSSDNSQAIFCECKWRNKKMPESDIDELISDAEMFPHKVKYFYYFSKSGFTSAALKKQDTYIRLISFADMF